MDEIYEELEHYARVKKDGGIVIKSPNFDIKLDYFDNKYRLYWIMNTTKKYKGTELFMAILEFLINSFHKLTTISATGIKGEFKGISVNGYYTMFRWGFIPDDGIEFVNDCLGTTYNSIEEAVRNKNFWNLWKENGEEYDGTFDMEENSLSWNILFKTI